MGELSMDSILDILCLFFEICNKIFSNPFFFLFHSKTPPNLSTYLSSLQALPYPCFYPIPDFWKVVYVWDFHFDTHICLAPCSLAFPLCNPSPPILNWEVCQVNAVSFLTSLSLVSLSYSTAQLFPDANRCFFKIVSLSLSCAVPFSDPFHFTAIVLTLTLQNHFSEL